MCRGRSMPRSGGVTINHIKWGCIRHNLFKVNQLESKHEVKQRAYQWIQNTCCRSMRTPGYSQLHYRRGIANFIISQIRSAIHLDVGVRVVVSRFNITLISELLQLPRRRAATNASVSRRQRSHRHALTEENPLWRGGKCARLRVPSKRRRHWLVELLIRRSTPCRTRRRMIIV